jgi:hypothetical protein
MPQFCSTTTLITDDAVSRPEVCRFNYHRPIVTDPKFADNLSALANGNSFTDTYTMYANSRGIFAFE